MSSMSLHKEICPKCGKEQIIERYDSINDFHSELFPKIVDKTIFDYECQFCKEKIHAPYPLLFHTMGIRDIQIGYKIQPINLLSNFSNPIIVAMKEIMNNAGHNTNDITESYNDEDEFAKRVSDFFKFI